MNFPVSNDSDPNTQTAARVYRVYPRRFAILAVFCICSLSSGFQWIEYVIIQNIIVRYYNQSLPESYEAKNNAVTWTSLSYMVILMLFD
jgi:FLVCR family feline leukemia virus subgroup C receptor-related protein